MLAASDFSFSNGMKYIPDLQIALIFFGPIFSLIYDRGVDLDAHFAPQFGQYMILDTNNTSIAMHSKKNLKKKGKKTAKIHRQKKIGSQNF